MNTPVKKYRNLSIDLLRGLAIVGMVLAAVIPWTSEFPGWMYHAQVAPPDFKFNPDRPGITWVDLVFPFFLFSMGAAFPFALKKSYDAGKFGSISKIILRRGLLLVVFAIALAYLTPENLTGSKTLNYLSSLTAFAAFFLLFMRFEGTVWRKYGLQALGALILILLTYYHSEVLGNTFHKEKSNIIILVLANMAVFGTLFWLLSANNIFIRIVILICFMGIWFTKDIPGSWTAYIWNFHPEIHWFYNFAFLKYLCIVLPGSILGDLIWKHKEIFQTPFTDEEKKSTAILATLGFLFVAFHVVCLYERWIMLDLIGHALFALVFYFLLKDKTVGKIAFYKQLVLCGFAFSTMGLFFEPLDGGIKKDPSTFSYWFITSGLAFIFYLTCDYLVTFWKNNMIIQSLVRCGQNPMIAYSVSAFFITPILGLIQVLPVLDQLGSTSPYLGLIRTVIFIVLMIFFTGYCTRRQWFWRS
ncbi:DUF5009 domain-containing protein [Sphingobacterium sp. DK4209]|uniref:DUF5009 domain-containing protein n=1 Tax=Sphingobacterium zhuxiongii TaxID=2662364 RepID=A0A5Q0QCL9_9SPHI|nr:MULTISPECIES: DUF5009 domain-containing protein [unclassified Sphingobacterium]MVZ64719.1 DUF5009 domain-containing protein [Sphingobacterium sp. DK4209]QGA27054.1 DUF5009 domain-containing protein [Sphingobacterium sp. dk4302]